MISLRSYLFGASADEAAAGDAESAYRRVISLFLQAIALHAVEGDKAEHGRFRRDLEALSRGLTAEASISELYAAAGEALRAMEDYNRHTTKFVERQSEELQKIVSMLTKTVIVISAGSETSVTRLQAIEKSIEGARVIDDIQAVKARLGLCLEGVREEALRQRADGQAALDNLKHEIEGYSQDPGVKALLAEVDTATGLPKRADAERAIQAACASGPGKFLFVAVINRVQAVNARFGFSIGDRVLATAAEHFHKNLSQEDELYRWQGPALVAILSRPQRLDEVRTFVQHFADAKLEKTIEVRGRTLLLPISVSWAVFPITSPADVFLKKVETFTAAQIPRDYV
jgi:GGDEF domain-containing protein